LFLGCAFTETESSEIADTIVPVRMNQRQERRWSAWIRKLKFSPQNDRCEKEAAARKLFKADVVSGKELPDRAAPLAIRHLRSAATISSNLGPAARQPEA
jgi:hypothetical protein